MRGVVPVEAAAPALHELCVDEDHQQHAMHVRLPNWQYRLVWIAIILVCTLNGLLGLLVALLYYAGMMFRGGYLLEGIGMLPVRDIPVLIGSYLLVALFFWQHLLSILCVSVHQCRLALPSRHSMRTKQRSWTQLKARCCWRLKLWRTTSATEVFEAKFLLRELVEIGLQTYQAYKCSTLISQTYINSFYVAMLTTNCWIAPIIYATTRHKPATQRLRYLLSDLVLDFTSTLVIPAWTLYAMVLATVLNNVKSVDDAAFDAPYDDVFLINVIKTVQQICVMSWLDFASKMMPFVSMASCLLHVEALLALPAISDEHKPTSNQVHASNTLATSELVATRASPADDRQVRSHSSSKLLEIRLVYLAFAAWGAVVLAAHLQAARVSGNASAIERLGCKSSSRPWLGNEFSCAVLEINCYRRGIDGAADEIDAALRPLNYGALSLLIIAHCPKLSIPPRIPTFSNLMGLELANSTLVQWGSDAALLNSNHRSLQFLTLVRLNMSALPEGLQSMPFPRQLRNFNIVDTNLTTLPEDLHTKWQKQVRVVAERNLFTQVPSTLGQMRPDILSLLGNNISDIPDTLLAGNRYSIISVARNPIKKLPDSVGSTDALTLVILDYTEIEELPAWLLEEGKLRAKTKESTITVSAGGSVFCENRLASGNSSALPGLKLSCRLKEDAAFEAYPMQFSLTNRQP